MQRLILVFALLVATVVVLWTVSPPLVDWADAQQKALQGDLARALASVRSGDLIAVASMIGLCAAYGVVHAIGPGHGKMLIGGAAVASRRTARRMAALGLAASLAQGLTAIILVYGGLGLFTIASRTLINLSETWLTAGSYAAIGAVGAWLAWRGARLALRLAQPNRSAGEPEHTHHHAGHHHADAHSGACAAGCRHAPTAHEVNRVESWRDALALIVSIGMRPCTGAMLVLVLSWSFETYIVGIASVFAMALGTGLVVATVALAAVRLRETGRLSETSPVGLWSFAAAQLCIGAAIVIVSASLAMAALDQVGRSHPLLGTPTDATPAAPLSEPTRITSAV